MTSNIERVMRYRMNLNSTVKGHHELRLRTAEMTLPSTTKEDGTVHIVIKIENLVHSSFTSTIGSRGSQESCNNWSQIVKHDGA